MAKADDAEFVSDEDPVVVIATETVQSGDLSRLDALLAEHPWLATAQFGDAQCHRTLLHAASDWPGNFPNGPDVIRRLVAAGADVNARSLFDGNSETPLHWAATSDDVPMLDALLDAGADIEAAGAQMGGGTALADACEFGNWDVARRLVERGARTRLKDAAALGLTDRVRAAFDGAEGPPPDESAEALWAAAACNQLDVAMFLVERGVDIDWVGWEHQTPLDIAERTGSYDVARWLRTRGGLRAREIF